MQWVTSAMWLLASAMGAAHAWAAAISHSMNEDGISYLDIGDATMRGDWQNAISAVWSPVYSWVLGLALRLFQPPMRWEFPLVHLVNFLIYLVALASFGLFWRQVRRFTEARLEDGTALPGWAFQAVGYLLFIWTSLFLIEIWAVTPDMLMSAIVYLAAAIVVRERVTPQRWTVYATLGLVLGLGYLTKTVMLPVAFLFVGAILFSGRGVRRMAPRAGLALVAFLLVAIPYIALISQHQGRFTYGESSTITYMRHVKGITDPYWQGEPPGNGTPLHPARVVFSDPPIYEFATPIGGTYPVGYDPSYWYEGFELRFDLRETMRAILSSLLVYGNLFLRELGPVLASILCLGLMVPWRARPAMQTASRWTLALVSVPVLALYSPVLVEGRYVGAFVVLLLSDLLANLSLPGTPLHDRFARAASLVMIIFLSGNLLVQNLEGLGALIPGPTTARSVTGGAPGPSWPGEVAEELVRLGIEPGSRVAVIGYSFDSYWARLARLRIVAEMPGAEAAPFYLGSPAFRSQVISAFAGTGAGAIVAEDVPAYATMDGWHQVGRTGYYVYPIQGWR